LEVGIGGTNEITLTATDLAPSTDAGSALGTTALAWNGLHLNTATAINWENGEVTITETDGNTLTIAGTATLIDLAAGILEVNNAVRFDTGVAIVAASYSVGRDADGTNQLHLNVPTGATFEFSVNDAVEATLSATAVNFQNNSITTTGGGSLTGTWTDLGTVTTVDINGGTVDGVTIGGAAAGAGTFTDITVALTDGLTVNIDGDGTPTADLVQIGVGDTTATAIDALDITLTTADGAGGTNLLNLNPTFASTINNSTHTALNIANIAATSTTNTLIARGINIGTMA
jgi:hypothetical protein